MDKLWVIVLGIWLFVAVPVSIVVLLVSAFWWSLLLVSIPLLVGTIAVLAFLAMRFYESNSQQAATIALIGLSASNVMLLLKAATPVALFYAFAMFATAGSGGIHGPGDVTWRVFEPAMPYVVAGCLFYWLPILSIVRLRR